MIPPFALRLIEKSNRVIRRRQTGFLFCGRVKFAHKKMRPKRFQQCVEGNSTRLKIPTRRHEPLVGLGQRRSGRVTPNSKAGHQNNGRKTGSSHRCLSRSSQNCPRFSIGAQYPQLIRKRVSAPYFASRRRPETESASSIFMPHL